jgi:hypothetical protein
MFNCYISEYFSLLMLQNINCCYTLSHCCNFATTIGFINYLVSKRLSMSYITWQLSILCFGLFIVSHR